jgi:hypothetical protein
MGRVTELSAPLGTRRDEVALTMMTWNIVDSTMMEVPAVYKPLEIG